MALAAPGVAAVAGVALGKKVLDTLTSDNAAQASTRGEGWGNGRSKWYAGGFCSHHQCPTTLADEDEFWWPHEWNQCMSLHYAFRRW